MPLCWSVLHTSLWVGGVMRQLIRSHPSVVSWASTWGFLLRSLPVTYFRGVPSTSGEAMLLCGSAGAPSEHYLWMVCYDYLFLFCVCAVCVFFALVLLFLFLFTFYPLCIALVILVLFLGHMSLSLCALYFCYLVLFSSR